MPPVSSTIMAVAGFWFAAAILAESPPTPANDNTPTSAKLAIESPVATPLAVE